MKSETFGRRFLYIYQQEHINFSQKMMTLCQMLSAVFDAIKTLIYSSRVHCAGGLSKSV